MKKKLLLISIIITARYCFSQNNFEKEIVKNFPVLSLPLDSVQFVKPKDTLNKSKYNLYYVVRKNNKNLGDKPKYIQKGQLLKETEYFGMLPEGGTSVESKGKNFIFYPKSYPIGRVILNKNYYSLIVKVFSMMSTYYDLHNFDKNGKLLSVVPLYYFENKKIMEEIKGVVHVRSSVNSEGTISWWENYPNRTRKRTYRLNENGLFEILSESIIGTLEE